jgi:hypothetical protein
MAKSIERVRAKLPAEKKEKFDQAVMTLALKDVAQSGLLGLASKTPAQLQAQAARELNGKTADEVIVAAEAIRAAERAKQLAQIRGEIKELEDKKVGAEKAIAELAKFEVRRSRFYKDTSGFLPKPIIEMTVTNGTGSPISRAYFVGTLASPGRAVPWLKHDLNYQVPGGLEPGETANWRLSPNIFTEWNVDAPKDAVFTVSVARLDGADGKVLFDGTWSEENEARLEALRKQATAGGQQ